MIAKLRRATAAVLIVCLSGIGMPMPAQAGMLATPAGSADRERIANLTDRADVRAQLEAYGVNPADVKARVAALTDAEAADLARNMDSAPAGGILGLILLVFLVLLITDILGLTKIFPFTKPIR
jgi:regulator of sirC expression with transglutaminase-like and TPR domain